MKKVLFFIISFMLLFMILSPVTALASEIAEESTNAEVTYHDIFTRVWEFVETNKTEVISAAGSGVLLVFSAITKKLNNKKNKELKDALVLIGNDAAGTSKSQTSVINAVNTMAAGYNEMRLAYEKYEAIEDDRNKLVGACLVTNTALLEILNSVYVHSKNLPQGVKDYVMLQYTNCQKAISNDELLLQVVESVRNTINEKAEGENEKQD